MSSLSWDFPSSSANPSADDDDDGNGLGQPSNGHDEDALVDLIEREQLEREQIEAMEREQLAQLEQLEQLGQIEAPEQEQIEALHADEQRERDQIEALEREQLERLAQFEQLEAAEIEESEKSEREQLEELEREQLRQLEQYERQQGAIPAAAPPAPPRQAPPKPPPVERPPAPVQPERSNLDAQARAAQFLAEANARQARLDQEAGAGQPWVPATERREMDERSRAARAIVEHRHQNLVEANALLTEARRTLAPIAYRGLSDRIYRRRKIILAIGEAVSLGVAFSAAFDVAPIEALLLSGAIALAFVIAGDLGGILRITAERSRLSAAMDDDVVHLDKRYHHILYHDRQQWLSIVGGVTAGIFALAAVSVGVLRAANQGSVGLAAGLGLLTVSLAVAAGLSSWQHASVGSEIIDHLQREEEDAARRLKRAASSRVLRRPQIMSVVGTDDLGLPSAAPDVDWSAPDVDWPTQAPDMDWQAPAGGSRATRAARGGRPAREKRDKREKRERASGGGLVGAAAARGAVFLATLPGKIRRPEKAAKAAKGSKGARAESVEELGDGPGALGESAGPISDVTFTPPVVIQRKFP